MRGRPARSFRPEASSIAGLESRTLLSGFHRHHHHHRDHHAVPIVAANVPYPTPVGPAEALDIYAPRDPAPTGGRPVILAIHGGGWRRLDKTGYGSRIASEFVARGYTVIAPNYALSARGIPTWPVNLDDLRSVVVWIRSNAGKLGINPNEIVAMGESAGAHLAELLGTDPGPSTPGSVSDKVNAVIAFSAPSNLTSLYYQSPLAGLAARQFLGGSPAQIPSQYVAASPIDHVAPGDPPMFLVHGRHDPLIPVRQSMDMAKTLAAAGVPVQLALVDGGHSLDYPVHFGDLTQRLLEFLSATWKHEGTPSMTGP